jgi:selenocysteine lyase/cysteine desulfurase
MPLPCQRQQFDLPGDITYLNCAYMGPLSHRVLTAGVSGLSRKSHPWKISPEDFFTEVELARDLFARVVGGDAEGVALLPSVSYGIATAARNLPVPQNSEIVVLAEQFPSNIYVWRDLAHRSNATLRTVARPTDGNWTREVLTVLSPKTSIAALPHCHWTDGTLLDLEKIGDKLRHVGARLVIDGCQSVGALPVDVETVRPDFLVTGSYKWLLGPYSHGFMWVAPEWRAGETLEQNWIARANSQDFAALVNYTEQYAPGARRFDVGEVSNFGLLPATIAALQQCLEWGVSEIQQTLRNLTDAIANHAQELGLGVASPENRSGHLIGLRLAGRDPQALAAALANAQVYVSVRGDSVRVSPHVYNDIEDVQRFVDVLTSSLTSGSHSSPATTAQ